MTVFSRRNGIRKLHAAKIVCLLLGLCFLPQMIFPQDNNTVPVPQALRRPERGEAPRYPEDLVIGELGQGGAPTGAYLYAQELLSALVRGTNNARVLEGTSSIITESMLEEIGSINARTYRIGGGRYELDGAVSFLVRFIGREESMIGELFVRYETVRVPVSTENTEDDNGEPITEPARREESRWLLDDLILEDKVSLSDITDDYRYDFSPYERFF